MIVKNRSQEKSLGSDFTEKGCEYARSISEI